VEGIAIWWLAERAAKKWLPQVERSLQQLVDLGLVLETRRADGRVVYHAKISAPRPRTARQTRRK
jgi:hypothetical protein